MVGGVNRITISFAHRDNDYAQECSIMYRQQQWAVRRQGIRVNKVDCHEAMYENMYENAYLCRLKRAQIDPICNIENNP